MAGLGHEPGIGELVGRLSRDTTLLVRQEIQLARSEISEKIAVSARALGAIAGGAVLGLLAGLALVATLVLVLIQVAGLPAWLSALIVAVVLGLIGLGLVLGPARTLKRLDPVPRRTVRTLEDDVRWAKEQP